MGQAEKLLLKQMSTEKNEKKKAKPKVDCSFPSYSPFKDPETEGEIIEKKKTTKWLTYVTLACLLGKDLDNGTSVS